MAYQNSQPNHRVYSTTGRVWTSSTPPLSTQMNYQQTTSPSPPQVVVHRNENNAVENRSSSQPSLAMVVAAAAPAAATSSSSSTLSTPQDISPVDARSEEERAADGLFDQIEDLICEFMRHSRRHYLHCRVLRWSLDDEIRQQFTAVVVINPPQATRSYQHEHNF